MLPHNVLVSQAISQTGIIDLSALNMIFR